MRVNRRVFIQKSWKYTTQKVWPGSYLKENTSIWLPLFHLLLHTKSNILLDIFFSILFLCSRFRSCLHRLPWGCGSSARLSTLGHPLLRHVAYPRSRQSGKPIYLICTNVERDFPSWGRDHNRGGCLPKEKGKMRSRLWATWLVWVISLFPFASLVHHHGDCSNSHSRWDTIPP